MGMPAGQKRQIGFNIGWLFSSHIVNMMSIFLSGVLTARYLGPENFGRYSFAYSYAFLFSAFFLQQINWLALREISDRPDESQNILGSIFALKSISGMIGFGICVMSACWFKRTDSVILFMIGVISFAMWLSIFETVSLYFDAQVNAKPIVIVRNSIGVFRLLLRVIMILWKLPLIYFALPFLVDAILMMVGCLYMHQRHGGDIFQWKIDRGAIFGIVNRSKWWILTCLFGYVIQRADQVLVEWFHGPLELGYYAVAVRLTEVLNFLPNIVTLSLMPAFVALAKKSDIKESIQRLELVMALMVWLAITFVIFTQCFGRQFVELVLGSRYIPSVFLWKIYVFYVFEIIAGSLRMFLWVSRGCFKRIFCFTALGLCAMLTLNILLIPSHGALGACWSQILYILFNLLITHFIFTDIREFNGVLFRSFSPATLLRALRSEIVPLFRGTFQKL